MKPLIAALILVLLTTLPAYCQGMGGLGGRHHKGAEQKTAEPKPKVDDKAYKSALDKIPDRPYDPWQAVRGK